MSNVVEFFPANAADNPDNVLKQAVGSCEGVLIIGTDKDGDLDVRASSNVTENDVIAMCERVKAFVLLGGFGGELAD